MTNQLNPHLWVNTHADYLYSFAISRLNDEEQARDLVQDTFLAALEKVGSFEGKASERTWLTAILKNKIIDVYRKKSSGLKTTEISVAEKDQDEFFDEQTGHWIFEHGPKEFGIEDKDHVVNREFEKILQQCMQKLPVLWKAVFTMKHIEEEATDTICTELKVTSSNFWVIIHRAKLNLKGLPSEKLDLKLLAMNNLKKIIYNCKKATFLIDKKSLGKISLREKIELRVHLFGCSFCRLYKKQSHVINEMVQELFKSSMKQGYRLDDDFKRSLQTRIEEELNK